MQTLQYIWSERRSLINVESHIRQYIYERDILGSTHDFSFLYARDLFAEELHRVEDNARWIAEGERLLDEKFARSLLLQGRAMRKEFASFLSSLKPKRLRSLTDDELVKVFLRSCRFHSRFRALFKTSRQEFLTQAEARLKERLAQAMRDSQEAARAFQCITSPVELDDVNKEILAREKLLSGGRITPSKVAIHLKRYPWLVAHSFGNERIVSEFAASFAEEAKDLPRIRKAVSEMLDYKKRLEEEQRRIILGLKDKEISYLSWLFRNLSLERMRLKGGWSGSDFLYGDLYEEISRRTGISPEDLHAIYRIDEVAQAISARKDILDDVEKTNRRKAYVLCWDGGKISFFSGGRAVEVMEQVLEKADEGKELKGQVASRGAYRGAVCLIFPGDLEMLKRSSEKFRKGNVLVTTMTQPNMVPLMRIAGAIVTDEGGLTSHAAIIARELKVPCIVGTKTGTKVLHDGDMVEVDADRGVVRRIH